MIKSERASLVPGDDLRTMSVAHKDTDGQEWPAGTLFRPLSAGLSNGRPFQAVSILGKRVTFVGDDKANPAGEAPEGKK